MRRADEAILIEFRPLAEADLLVTALTRAHGLVRGVARSARRSRRRFGGALDPLSHVQLRWVERSGRDLQTLESADVVHSYASAQADPAVQAACAVVAEILRAGESHASDDDRTFRLVVAVLDALEGGEPPLAVVRYFEAWFLRIHGVTPDPDRCAQCAREVRGPARLSRSDGSPRCAACARRDEIVAVRLDGRDREFLHRTWQSPPRDLATFDVPCRAGGALETMLRGGVEQYLERSLRTYRHLHQMTLHRPREAGATEPR